MLDPRFEILEEGHGTQKASRRSARTVGLIALLALTLVLGAFYLPVLLDTPTASASPLRQETPAVPIMVASLVEDQDALANLYDAIAPSVVSIQTSGDIASLELPPGFPQDQLPEDGLIPQGQGSGWIFDNDGHIVTNNHVVENAKAVTVVFYDGSWADAEVVATDPQADLAVLKVEPPAGFPWRALNLADGDSLRVGHSVVAIGNPFGYASTMTTGIVSALGRSFATGSFGENRYTLPEVIQTDAAINPGNSGGPLVNLDGEVVGVNFAIESVVRANSGVGFAIPGSIVNLVVPALIEDGSFVYPYLGLSGTSVTPALAKELEIENTQLGAYVATVVPGGPAEEAGIVGADPDTSEGGDLVVSFNGEPVRSFDELVGHLVTTTRPGDTATLGIIRDGEAMDIALTVGERPNSVATRVQPQEAPQSGPVNARAAIRIAEQETEGMLDGAISEKTATPDERNGVDVWVVELATETQTATVVIERASGEVLEVSVE